MLKYTLSNILIVNKISIIRMQDTIKFNTTHYQIYYKTKLR